MVALVVVSWYLHLLLVHSLTFLMKRSLPTPWGTCGWKGTVWPMPGLSQWPVLCTSDQSEFFSDTLLFPHAESTLFSRVTKLDDISLGLLCFPHSPLLPSTPLYARRMATKVQNAASPQEWRKGNSCGSLGDREQISLHKNWVRLSLYSLKLLGLGFCPL